jgi:hypothetical protein
MQHVAFSIDVIELHAARLRYAQTVPEHEEQAAVADGLSAALVASIFDQPFNLATGEVLAVATALLCARLRRRGAGSC